MSQVGSRVSILWMVSAFVIMTVSEVMVSVIGLELAFRAAPPRMKSFVTACWLLMVIVAGVLPWLLNLRVPIAWLLLGHAPLVWSFMALEDFNFWEALFQSAFYVGFAAFVLITAYVARQQAEAREEQRRLNAELRATRVLLAESARVNERTRISRELHDLLGHHLTALSLNLEVAGHMTEGRAQEHVKQAHTLARLLLTDVREVVSQLREGDAIDLGAALLLLTDRVPSLEIHMDTQEPLALEDAERAHILLRCTQEIITNAVRHADARNLWIVDRDGSDARQLTDGNSDILPSAANDGKSVVFMSMRSGRSNIWRADLATGATSAITTGDFESSPSLGPDGTWLAYHTNRSGVRTVWRAAMDGSGARQVTTTASSWPSVSPDGKRIACSWFDPSNGRIGIAVVPSEGGTPEKIFDIPVNAWMGGNNHHVRWRSDGLTYVQNAGGVSNIWLQPLDGGQPRALTRFDEGQIFYFDWSADGRDLIVSRGSVTSNVVLINGFR
jgi:signal transduction histidine kinase